MADVNNSGEVRDHLEFLLKKCGNPKISARLKMQIIDWIKREVDERENLKSSITSLINNKSISTYDTRHQKVISKSAKELAG